MIKMQGAHPPSSFWILDKGLAPPGVMLDVAPMDGCWDPPPPRNGFAIRPKVNGDAAAAFCAKKPIGLRKKTVIPFPDVPRA